MPTPAPHLTVLRPRPLRPSWGEVVYNGNVLASGDLPDHDLLREAAAVLAAKEPA